MNTCPNCGKMAGLHGSVLQGCMCQYSMQAPVMREGKDFTISKPWVGLTDEQKLSLEIQGGKSDVMLAELVEGWLKEKNT